MPSRPSPLPAAFVATLAAALALGLLAPPVLAQPARPAPPDPPPKPSTPPVPDAGPAADEFQTPPEVAERHPSGLVSLLLEPGDGQDPPDGNDIVQLHFTGWDRSGKLFRTSRTGENQPMTMSLANVFPGWQEGIQLMVSGEKRRLWIPSHLGPTNAKAGPRSAVFDVELLGIARVPNPPDSLSEPPESAERLPNGLHSRRLQRGQGYVKPEADGRVLVHYIAWDERGDVVDSTFGRARPMAFLLDRMLPALSEVLQDMTVGERRQVWVPEYAHQGQWPGSPKGMMVFDLQLFYILPTDAIQPKPGATAPGAAPGGGGPAASGGPAGGGR